MKTAFFPTRMLGSLPADNYEALAAIITEYERFDGHARQVSEQHDDYVEALGILRAFGAARDAKLAPFPEIGPQRQQNIANINAYFAQLRNTVRAELSNRNARGHFDSKTQEYLSLFSRVPMYEFSDADFQRAQELMNELRELLRTSALLNEDQKRRLQRKLDNMRVELNKKTTDIDRFWGFLGEASIAMRKFGADLDPIAERVQELAGIVIDVIFAREGITALPELRELLCPQEVEPESEQLK
jgi:hypothetical protein